MSKSNKKVYIVLTTLIEIIKRKKVKILNMRILKPLLPHEGFEFSSICEEKITVVPYSQHSSVVSTDQVPVTGLYAALTLIKPTMKPREIVKLVEVETNNASFWKMTKSGILKIVNFAL